MKGGPPPVRHASPRFPWSSLTSVCFTSTGFIPSLKGVGGSDNFLTAGRNYKGISECNAGAETSFRLHPAITRISKRFAPRDTNYLKTKWPTYIMWIEVSVYGNLNWNTSPLLLFLIWKSKRLADLGNYDYSYCVFVICDLHSFHVLQQRTSLLGSRYLPKNTHPAWYYK